MPGKVLYSSRWEDPAQYPQYADCIKPVKHDIYSAQCSKCRGKPISLSNMGVAALGSHAKGKKHVAAMKSTCIAPLITSFSLSSSSSSPISGSSGSVSGSSSSISRSGASGPISGSCGSVSGSGGSICGSGVSVLSSLYLDSNSSSQSSKVSQQGKVYNLITYDVTKAEIIWIMKMITQHFSLNSCKDINAIFKEMFNDSKIAADFQFGPNKASSAICFGLPPYFKNIVLNKLKSPTPVKFTTCFDEAFNTIIHKGQFLIVMFSFLTMKKSSFSTLSWIFISWSFMCRRDLKKVS